MLSRANFFAARNLSISPALFTRTVKNWIEGKAVDSKTSKWIDLTNPVFLTFKSISKK